MALVTVAMVAVSISITGEILKALYYISIPKALSYLMRHSQLYSFNSAQKYTAYNIRQSHQNCCLRDHKPTKTNTHTHTNTLSFVYPSFHHCNKDQCIHDSGFKLSLPHSESPICQEASSEPLTCREEEADQHNCPLCGTG